MTHISHHGRVRRALSKAIMVGSLAPTCVRPAFSASAFPTRLIKIIVPFPAGAATDYVARMIGQTLSALLRVPVIVHNVGGAGGSIGAAAAARAEPDGYTLFVAPASYAINPSLYPNLTYGTKTLVPLGVAVNSQLVTAVRNDLPVQEIKGLIALAKKPGNVINFGSAGNGTIGHLGIEILKSQTGANFNHVPYRGSQPAMTDLLGGAIDALIDQVGTVIGPLATGKIKLIGLHSNERCPFFPVLPTYAEQGLDAMTFDAWNAFMVPKNVPVEIQRTLTSALTKAVRVAKTEEDFRKRGLTIVTTSPSQYSVFMQNESARWGALIKARNIKL